VNTHESTSTDAWTIYLYYTTTGMGYHATKRTGINATALSTSVRSAVWDYKTGDAHAVLAGRATGNVTAVIHCCPK
jgi:hypothetical protein